MCNFDEKAVIERVRQLRRNYSGPRGKRKFAKAIGLSPSTYNYYEKDRIAPIPVLLKICRVCNADLEWLLTGRESQKKEGSVNSALMQSNPELAQKSTNLVNKIEHLISNNPDSVHAVLAFIELLSEHKSIESSSPLIAVRPKSTRPGWIPVLGRTAAGIVHFWNESTLPEPEQAIVELDELVKKHTGQTILKAFECRVSVDLPAKPLAKGLKSNLTNIIQVSSQGPDELVHFVENRELYELFPDSFALQIDGDSMSPRINDGDYVILSPSVPAAQGQAAVVRLANQIGVTCKLIRTTESEAHLIPINEQYDTKIVTKKDLLWALAVLCHIKMS